MNVWTKIHMLLVGRHRNRKAHVRCKVNGHRTWIRRPRKSWCKLRAYECLVVVKNRSTRGVEFVKPTTAAAAATF